MSLVWGGSVIGLTVENLINLLVVVIRLITGALILIILLILFISKIETSAVGHMHLKTAWCETLGLLLIDSSDLLFRMADGAIVFLRVLLHQLVLERLLVDVKFLTVTCDTGLAWVNRSLHRRDHVQQIGIIFGVSDVIKPRMLQSLFTSYSISGVQCQKTAHQT